MHACNPKYRYLDALLDFFVVRSLLACCAVFKEQALKMMLEEALKILGLAEGATEADAKKAYRKLALKWHPDKNGGDPAATKRFQQISTAYRRVTDPDSFEDEDDELTEEDMMEMFAMMFGEMFGWMLSWMSSGIPRARGIPKWSHRNS